MQFVTAVVQNSPAELWLWQDPQHWRSYLPASVPDQSVVFVPHTIAVLHSHLGRAAFVGCGEGSSCREHLHQ